MSDSQTTQTPMRYRARPKQWRDKDWLYEQYWGGSPEQWQSIPEMAEVLDVSTFTIRQNLIRYGIQRRCQTHHTRNDYDPIEARRPEDDSTGGVY